MDTNLNKSDLPSDLAKDLCKVVAQILNKPIDVRKNDPLKNFDNINILHLYVPHNKSKCS